MHSGPSIAQLDSAKPFSNVHSSSIIILGSANRVAFSLNPSSYTALDSSIRRFEPTYRADPMVTLKAVSGEPITLARDSWAWQSTKLNSCRP